MPITPKRGAKPTPASMIASTARHVALIGAPPQMITIPPQLSMWGNDVHGDCVTAEEAFAKACHNPEVFIPEADVIAWASAHGVLEGANLGEVLQWMQTGGFQEGASLYNDGPFFTVDWKNSATLHSAIALGPVKLGIAGDQILAVWDAANGKSGWFATGLKNDNAEDHCVSLCGYGTIAWLAQQLKVQVPHGVDGTKPGYALYTWDTIGIIDVPSLLAITQEAWLRNPTTVVKGDFAGKVTLGDTTPKSPALASLNGWLHLAWKGDGNDHLNMMCSSDGHTFGPKFISPETSPVSPALCAHNGILIVAWKGDGNDHLNVAHVTLTANHATGFTNKAILGDQSPLSPALASFNGHLFIAWKGDGNNNLNLMYSSDNGATFGNKFTSPETSVQSPSLAVANGNLYVSWKGASNDQLNVARVVMAGNAITGLANKVTLPDTSPLTPALASNGSTLYLAWKGDGNDHLNVESSTNGASFGNKIVSSNTSPQAPALAVVNGRLYIAWKGDGNDNLNVAFLPA